MTGHAEIKEALAVYDSLSREAQIELHAHIIGCAECAEELAAFRRMDRALRALPDPGPSARLQLVIQQAAAREQGSRTQPAPEPQPALSRRLPQAPPEPESATEAPAIPAAPFRWQRLLVPLVLALLFVGSLFAGMRMEAEPSRNRVEIKPTVAPVTNGFEDRALPIPPTEMPLTIDASGHVTITFACDDVAAVYRDYAAIARAFEEQNPDISITLKSYRDILESTFSTLYESNGEAFMEAVRGIGSRADVFCARRVPDLAQRGIIRDLSPLIARDPSFDLPDYYEVVLRDAMFDDAVYGLPGRFQPTLIHYDPQAFDEAGLSHPQPGWTWSDFYTAAVALTQRENGNTQRWGFGEDRAAVFRARLAEALRNTTFNAAALGSDIFAEPALVELFTWYEDFYVNERAALPPRAAVADDAGNTPDDVYRSQILRGKLAMWTDQFYAGARRQGRPAPFPADNAARGGTPVTTGVIWVMSDEVQHTDAAWCWLSYLSRNPPPDRVQMLPARKSLVAQADFWSDLSAEDARVYQYVLDHLAPWPDFSNDQRAQGLAQLLMSAVARGEISVADLRAIAEDREPAAVQPGAQTITITFAAPRDHHSDYERAAAAFSEINPGIRIRIAPSEDLLPSRSGTEILWNQMRVLASRVDAMVNGQVPALVRGGRAQGILYDLTELISETLRSSDYYPNTLAGLQWRGRTLAIPGRIGLELIHYKESVFDQVNLAYPQPGWTWDDFDRTARAVALPGEGDPKWWGWSDRNGRELQLLRSRIGPLVDYTTNPTMLLLDKLTSVEGAAWYGRLLADGIAAPASELEAEAAMWAAAVDIESLHGLRDAGVGVAPFPVGVASMATTPLEILDAFAISADTRHPEVAWQWLLYLQFNPPLIEGRAGELPARRDHGAKLELPADPRVRAVIEYALEHTRRPASLRPEEYFATQYLTAALDRIVQDGQAAQTALQEAQASAERDLGRR